MTRRPGPGLRARLAVSYSAVVVLTGVLLLTVVWTFLLRYVPTGPVDVRDGFVPSRGDLVDAFLPPAVAALAGLLGLGLLGGWLLAGRVLAPLGRITEATRLVAAGSLSHRVRLPGRDDELRELADALDAMLARLEAHVTAQQRFAANASHELRTPLAVTGTLLDVARRDPAHDHDRLLERLAAVNARAVDLTEALLLLSRADAEPAGHEAVDLSLLAEEAVEALLPLAEARGVALEAAGDPAVAVGSPALLLQLVTNLLHNGIVHGTVPGGAPAEVLVRTEQRGPVARLVVENGGQEVPPELVPTLTEAFQRGSARVRGDDAGVGLGLAIVDAVVRAHGGSLVLTPRSGGGLVVEVELPAGTP